MQTVKTAKELKENDIIIDGKHRLLVVKINNISDKAIAYTTKVISETSKGFGICGVGYKRLETKVRVL